MITLLAGYNGPARPWLPVLLVGRSDIEKTKKKLWVLRAKVREVNESDWIGKGARTLSSDYLCLERSTVSPKTGMRAVSP